VVQSFEPGEDWFWDYRAQTFVAGPELTPLTSHPRSQPVPGGHVPVHWVDQLEARDAKERAAGLKPE
jgi:hypothetical protein